MPTFHKKIRNAISTISPTEGIKEHISKLERIIRNNPENNSAGDVIPDIQKMIRNFNCQDDVPEPQFIVANN